MRNLGLLIWAMVAIEDFFSKKVYFAVTLKILQIYLLTLKSI